ncbi:DUF2637 domain-containing protein [Streptomyces xiamenensis]|uniref:DUF2637 domain-containing protein n=1 Tax=Streptomyces xiamenensis TaxID=408015 RepID=UPI0035DB92F9
MAQIKLTRAHRVLVGIILAGAVVIAAIGFAGSYTAVRDLAERKGFGSFAHVFPLGIDVGILVLLSLDVLMTWMRMPFPLLRQTAWLLTAATIAFNGAAAWGDPLAVGMHAIIPVLFVITVEAARHAIGRIADITADKHMEGVRMWRWLLSPIPTFRLWRRMKLWELRSYDEVITTEQDRLVYQTRLRAKYGRAWRRRAPVKELMPLKLARLGVPIPETIQSITPSVGVRTAQGDASLPVQRAAPRWNLEQARRPSSEQATPQTPSEMKPAPVNSQAELEPLVDEPALKPAPAPDEPHPDTEAAADGDGAEPLDGAQKVASAGPSTERVLAKAGTASAEQRRRERRGVDAVIPLDDLRRMEEVLPDEEDVTAEGLNGDEEEETTQGESFPDYTGWAGQDAVHDAYWRLGREMRQLSARALGPILAERTGNLVRGSTARRYVDNLRRKLLVKAHEELDDEQRGMPVPDLASLLAEQTGLTAEMSRHFVEGLHTKRALASVGASTKDEDASAAGGQSSSGGVPQQLP